MQSCADGRRGGVAEQGREAPRDRCAGDEARDPGEEVRPGVTRHELGGGRAVYLLVQGRLVNIAGADGHPVEIMDLSFSV